MFRTLFRYQIDPSIVSAGAANCAQAYGTARPTPLFNASGKAKCCVPIRERNSAGVVVNQCLG